MVNLFVSYSKTNKIRSNIFSRHFAIPQQVVETLTILRHENNLRMILEQLDPVFVEVEILYKSLETKLTHLSPFPIETITFLMLLQTRFLKKLAPAPLNPFVPSVTILYPLKISTNLRFSDVFGGYRNVTLKKMGYVELLNESFE